MKSIFYAIWLLIAINLNSQSDDHFNAYNLDPSLTETANAVLRFEKTIVEVEADDKIILKNHRIVTVLNKNGNRHRKAVEFYNDQKKVNSISAKVYNAFGKEVKKFKERDFKDESAVSDFSIYEDDRVKYLEYIPLEYPYTVEYTSEIEIANTAFFPAWRPISGYFLSVGHAEYQILNNSEVELKLKKENFEKYGIKEMGEYHYVVNDLPGIKYEAYSPDLYNEVPVLKGAMKSFNMVGVEGENNNWNDFGKWMHDRLLVGTDDIPDATKQEILELTKNAESDVEKAKLVYKYMQDRTRYISIQIGIGGWKPMMATEVDAFGYGDCKGLTNYTKALMDIAGVTTYYTVVYGGNEIRDLDSDFSSVQGNHVILSLPVNEDYVFLECTSQTNPFGFIAGFTDDRDVLLIKEEGGEIVHTTIYDESDSYLKSNAHIQLGENGGIRADLKLRSKGIMYNNRSAVETMNQKERVLDYKDEWGYLNDLSIDAVEVVNSKDEVELIEKIEVSARSYASKSGNRFLFQPNVFNRRNYIPPRYSNRQLDFEIARSFQEQDEYMISYPDGLQLEASANDVEIESKYGVYKMSIEVLDNNQIKYKRHLIMHKGLYGSSEYDDYRDFRKQIVKNDKSKIVFITK